MAQKNATLRALIEGVIYDLMPKGSVYNVWVDDTTTLAEKLAEVIASLNGKVTQEQLETAIEEALADFDGGVSPEQVAEAIESAILENGIIKHELLPEGYPYTGFAEIFPEQTISFPEETDYQAPLMQPIGLVAGGTYEVSWNRTVYFCVAESAVLEGAQIVIMGDPGAMSGEPTGSHPFTIVEFPPEFAGVTGGIYGAIVPLDGSESAVISIRDGAITPIDPKFMPVGYKAPNPYALTFTGAVQGTYDGSEALTINIPSGGNGGSASTDVLLGQTPIRFTKAANMVRLVGNGEITYTIESDTVADMESAVSQSSSNAKITVTDDYVEIKSTSGATAGWYQSYVDIVMEGLIVGETYAFVVDASGIDWDEANRVSNGSYILYDASGATLVSTTNADHQHNIYSANFTATTESVKCRAYPGSYMWLAGETASRFNSVYINKSGTSTLHTTIINETGSFNSSVLLPGLSAGVQISSEPSCYVYGVQSADSSSGSRHNGKVMVCFGDSITGNMTAPNDYPSVIARETGMEVINAGFGGCRMSDTHSDASYAAFSMVKLADAVFSGDWSLQDGKVSGLSTVTNGTAHLEALKAVDWSKVDFVSIAYGTNDIQSAITIDSDSDKLSTNTVLGSLRYAITKILTAYPHIKLILLTPIYRYFNDEGVDSDNKTFGGKAFTDWGEGIISVAKEYKVPFIDMYNTLGINSINRTYYFPASDGTHPNAKGLALIGGKIAAGILSQY